MIKEKELYKAITQISHALPASVPDHRRHPTRLHPVVSYPPASSAPFRPLHSSTIPSSRSNLTNSGSGSLSWGFRRPSSCWTASRSSRFRFTTSPSWGLKKVSGVANVARSATPRCCARHYRVGSPLDVAAVPLLPFSAEHRSSEFRAGQARVF
jgi:hypothetical protein